MLPPGILWNHLVAFATVWGLCILAGWGMAAFLPRTIRGWDRMVAVPILGVTYWSACLYLLPFAGGTFLALFIAGVLALAAIKSLPGGFTLTTREWQGTALLAIAFVAYASPLVYQFVPLGMDASMYAYNARAIGLAAGLPATYAPFAPEVPFSGVNQGLAAVAGAAVSLGVSPVSAVLAGGQLSFFCLVLGVVLICRLTTTSLVASTIAVASSFFARSAQASLEWGGFPNILAIGVGLAGARLLVDQMRHGTWRSSISLGVVVGALPILHGISAAGWIFTTASVAFVTGWTVSRQRYHGIVSLCISASLAGVIVAAYLAAAASSLDGSVGDLIRHIQMERGPQGTGLVLAWNGIRFLATAADVAAFSFAVAAMLALALTFHARRIAVVLGGFLFLWIVVLNAQWGILPATRLLWPERAAFFIGPWVGLTLALAYRPVCALLRRLHAPKQAPLMVAVTLLVLAGLRHNHYFQRKATAPAMSPEVWNALVEMENRLDPGTDFVWSVYGTEGAYLPAIAGIATNAWHVNCVHQQAGSIAATQRKATHFLYIDPAAMRLSKSRAAAAPAMQAELKAVHNSLREIAFQTESVRLYTMQNRVAALTVELTK